MSTPDAFEPFSAFALLSVTVVVNGEVVTCLETMPAPDWEYVSSIPELRAAYERMIRGRLADAVVERLNPPLTVDLPQPSTGRASGVSASAGVTGRGR